MNPRGESGDSLALSQKWHNLATPLPHYKCLGVDGEAVDCKDGGWGSGEDDSMVRVRGIQPR